KKYSVPQRQHRGSAFAPPLDSKSTSNRTSDEEGSMEQVDSIIHARWVVPVEPHDVVLEQHSLAIRDGRIVALLPEQEARERYCAELTHELPRHALIP